MLEENGNDSRKFWKSMRQLLGGAKSKNKIEELMGSSDSNNVANNYFTDKRLVKI